MMFVSQNSLIDSHLSVCVHIDSLIVVAEEKLHPVRVGQHDDGVGRYGTSGMLGEVDVVDGGRVEVDGVEAARRTVDYLEDKKLKDVIEAKATKPYP